MAFFNRENANKAITKKNRYIQLIDENKQPIGGLISYSSEFKKSFEEEFRSLTVSQGSPQLNFVSATIIDKLGSLGSIVANGIQAGKLMQIVNPPEVIKGLADGTIKLMQTQIGNTGSALREGSSKIFRQARFAPANVAPIVAPVMVYQILNAVAGAYQLSKINARLDSMQRSIDSINTKLNGNKYGRLTTAINSLEELRKQHAIIGYFSEDMRYKLAIATHEIQTVYHESGYLIDEFQKEIKDLQKTNQGKSGATKTNIILKEKGPDYVFNTWMFIAASQAKLLVADMWIKHDLQFVPEYVAVRMQDLDREIQILHESVSPMNAIHELKTYAEKCLDEMNIFQRLFSLKLNNEILGRPDYENVELKIERKAENKMAQSIYIWKDKNKIINVVTNSEIIDAT